MEETNSTTVTVAKRPTFITVLCILSFVGIALSLAVGIYRYFDFSASAAEPSLFGQIDSSDPLGQAMIEAMGEGFKLDYAKLAMNELIVVLLNIPVLIGVLMMWKLKRVGFYIYAAFGIIQSLMPLMLGLEFNSMVIYGIVATAVFIVLYAINLKHMV